MSLSPSSVTERLFLSSVFRLLMPSAVPVLPYLWLSVSFLWLWLLPCMGSADPQKGAKTLEQCDIFRRHKSA